MGVYRRDAVEPLLRTMLHLRAPQMYLGVVHRYVWMDEFYEYMQHSGWQWRLCERHGELMILQLSPPTSSLPSLKLASQGAADMNVQLGHGTQLDHDYVQA